MLTRMIEAGNTVYALKRGGEQLPPTALETAYHGDALQAALREAAQHEELLVGGGGAAAAAAAGHGRIEPSDDEDDDALLGDALERVQVEQALQVTQQLQEHRGGAGAGAAAASSEVIDLS